MECLNFTSEDMNLLADVFLIYSAFGIVVGLFLYDFVCWLAFSVVRRFGSRVQEEPES